MLLRGQTGHVEVFLLQWLMRWRKESLPSDQLRSCRRYFWNVVPSLTSPDVKSKQEEATKRVWRSHTLLSDVNANKRATLKFSIFSETKSKDKKMGLGPILGPRRELTNSR